MSSDSSLNQKLLQPFKSGPTKELFKAYHLIFNKEKEYQLYSDEGVRRYTIFKENLKSMEETNSKNLGYTLGFTEFTDLTQEEYIQRNEKPSKYISESQEEWTDEESNSNFLEHKSAYTYTPGTVKLDWTSYMNPVPTFSRGLGGLSYANYYGVVTAAIEGGYFLATGSKISVSFLQPLYCKTYDALGWYPDGVLNYFVKNGVAPADFKCGKNISNNWNKILVGYVQSTGSMDSFLNMLKNGPVIVAFDQAALKNYVGGIIDPSSCQSSYKLASNLDVAIVVGINSDGASDYLLVQHSLGSQWGENGFFRIKINPTTNKCGMIKNAFQPKFSTPSLF